MHSMMYATSSPLHYIKVSETASVCQQTHFINFFFFFRLLPIGFVHIFVQTIHFGTLVNPMNLRLGTHLDHYPRTAQEEIRGDDVIRGSCDITLNVQFFPIGNLHVFQTSIFGICLFQISFKVDI